ncbi:MAG: AI-2E family transporter, partial [Rhodocyclaceae bacterium]|nr:AI-2E family transporter [Rhodocyclaceae bacterium]
LPVVGASLVWVPLAIYLFVTGSPWEAVGLVAFGVLVIGLVDNVLRPILIGHDTGLPDYLVMITTFGGIALLGINGFVIGPTVAAMFIAVWHIQTETRFAPPPETKKTLATGSASPVAPCAAAQTRAENARQI